MTQWLQSGRRRDICALLYDAGWLRGQELKSELEATYDARIDPSAFYGSLEALIDRGLVAERTEGIHDVYRLTEAGVDGVESYYAWLSARVDGGSSDASTAESE